MTALLAEIGDRTQAESISNTPIAVSRSALPQLEEDEFYWADLLGFSVETPQQTKLGMLDGLLETSAADVLVVKGEAEHLIPAALILEVDMDGKRVTVDWDLDY